MVNKMSDTPLPPAPAPPPPPPSLHNEWNPSSLYNGGGGGSGKRDLTRKSSSRYGDHQSSSHINNNLGQITYRIDGKDKTLDDVIEVRY